MFIRCEIPCLSCGSPTAYVAEIRGTAINVPARLPCCGVGCQVIYTKADLIDEAEATVEREEQERKVEDSIKEANDNEPRMGEEI